MERVAKRFISGNGLTTGHIRILLIMAGTLALLWPAMVNRGAFWFPDTSNYIRAADAATVVATGMRSDWSDRLVIRNSVGKGKHERTHSDVNLSSGPSTVVPTRPVISGRSIYYGFLIYIPIRMFGAWAAIGLQALLVTGLIATCIGVAARRFRMPSNITLAVVLAVLALATPLPFFTSMLMPDVFSGLIALALVTLMIFWPCMRVPERATLLGSSAIIATFHTTHVLITAAVGAAAFFLFITSRSRYRPLLIIAPVLVVAVLAEIAFSSAVEMKLGRPPLSPPFLSARITASGPGTAFLRETCASSPEEFTLCKYRHRLPVDSDTFLWSESMRGVFQAAAAEDQRTLAEEDKSFFLAVLADRPFEVASVLMNSAAQTATMFNLSGFNYGGERGGGYARKVPANVANEMASTRAFKGLMPTSATVIATISSTIISLVIVVVLICCSISDGTSLFATLRRYALLVVLAVLANTAICGALSKATARYQMRFIWLLPAAAAVVAMGWSTHRWGRLSDQPQLQPQE